MFTRVQELQASEILEKIFHHHVKTVARYSWNNKRIIEVLPFDSACHNLVAEFLAKLETEKEAEKE